MPRNRFRTDHQMMLCFKLMILCVLESYFNETETSKKYFSYTRDMPKAKSSIRMGQRNMEDARQPQTVGKCVVLNACKSRQESIPINLIAFSFLLCIGFRCCNDTETVIN